MVDKRRRSIRGLAEPVMVRKPLLIRLCEGFLANLTLILRTAFVIGAIFLVQDLRSLLEDSAQPAATTPAQVTVEVEPLEAPEAEESVLSEGVIHALNCTYEDFRNSHYDECVDDRSRIYPRPPGADDTGYILYDSPILYAHFQGSGRSIRSTSVH